MSLDVKSYGIPHYYGEKFNSHIIFSVTAPTKTENAPIILYSIRYITYLVKTYNEIDEWGGIS